MMVVQLPQKFLKSLQGIKGFDKEAFEMVHGNGEQITSIRINPRKEFKIQNSKSKISNIPWAEHGFYLGHRPSFTFDPLFHAGCYYVQEASSMFLEQALKQTVDLSQPLKILDLAAAPGGKSTHIQSLITKSSLLVSNEVIRPRSNILKNNMIKWGGDNVVVTNNDPKDFARLKNYFDVIVVDAPCSGSGLFRRDNDTIAEWSENNVNLCSRRQQRILADVWPGLKNGGVLIYSTCSYSREEDEDIIQWMNSTFSIQHATFNIQNNWNIIESPRGYRFWPDKVRGEGFFIACVKKKEAGDEAEIKGRGKFELLNKKELQFVNNWIKPTGHLLVKVQNTVYAVPDKLLNDINLLSGNLHVIYFGTMIGEIVREKFIPCHSLAMSNLVSDNIERVELNEEQSILYLKKKELQNIHTGRGWKLITYKNYPLGWVNVLPNRINNYYPKELRILKDI